MAETSPRVLNFSNRKFSSNSPRPSFFISPSFYSLFCLYHNNLLLRYNISWVFRSALKQSGMHWTVRSANSIIALRCCILSRLWEDFWEYRAAAWWNVVTFLSHTPGFPSSPLFSYALPTNQILPWPLCKRGNERDVGNDEPKRRGRKKMLPFSKGKSLITTYFQPSVWRKSLSR